MTRWRRVLAVSAWSLRSRLLAGVLVLAAVGLTVSGFAATALLHDYLVNQVDQQLAGAARGVGRFAELPNRPPPNRQTNQLPTPFVITQLDASGQITDQVGGSTAAGGPVPMLTGLTVAAARAKDGTPFTVPAVSGGTSFRVRSVVRPDGTGTATIAISLESVNSTVHRLRTVIILVSVVVILGLIALGLLVVRLGLRPLTRVEQTAEEIAAGDLSRRIPQAPDRTEIGRLSRVLNDMLNQIERAFSARQQSEATLRRFVADAGHELRTPLTTIRGYAELSRKGAFPDQDAERQGIARIESEAARLGRLVDDLLLLADLDQQRPLHITAVDMRAVALDATADARVRDPQRLIDCRTPEGPVYVTADADRLSQIVANLVGNALVHTPAGTPVHLTVSQSPGQATITVADEGPGIPDEHRQHIFDRFYRADAGRSRAQGGTGLGLAIVQAVTHACGGSVDCRPGAAGGAEFTITLPAAQGPS